MHSFVKAIICVFAIYLSSAFQLKSQDVPKWNINKGKTTIGFTVKHVFVPVDGLFKEFDGSIKFHPEDLENSSAEFVIYVSSVETGNKDRDKHLQSEDFFDGLNFPEIHFVSTTIEKIDSVLFSVSGNIAMKGVSEMIEFPLEITDVIYDSDQNVMVHLIAVIKTNLKRNNYGIGKGNWASNAVVGNKVKINIDLVLEFDK